MSGNRGKGRPKGSRNKSTAAVKEAMELAFGALGGQQAFEEWAKKNPDTYYGVLLPKLLPVQMQHSGNPDEETPIQVSRIELVAPSE